jgi:hypothetical protein
MEYEYKAVGRFRADRCAALREIRLAGPCPPIAITVARSMLAALSWPTRWAVSATAIKALP